MSAVPSNFYNVPQPLVDDNCLICRDSLQNGEPLSAHTGENGAKHPMHTQCLQHLFKQMDTSVCPACLEQTNPNSVFPLKERIMRTAKTLLPKVKEVAGHILHGALGSTTGVALGAAVGATAATIAAITGRAATGTLATGAVIGGVTSCLIGVKRVVDLLKGHVDGVQLRTAPLLGFQLGAEAVIIGAGIAALGVGKTAIAAGITAGITGLTVAIQLGISEGANFLSGANPKSIGGRIVALGATIPMGVAVCLEEIGQSPTIAGGVVAGITVVSVGHIAQWYQEWNAEQDNTVPLKERIMRTAKSLLPNVDTCKGVANRILVDATVASAASGLVGIIGTAAATIAATAGRPTTGALATGAVAAAVPSFILGITRARDFIAQLREERRAEADRENVPLLRRQPLLGEAAALAVTAGMGAGIAAIGTGSVGRALIATGIAGIAALIAAKTQLVISKRINFLSGATPKGLGGRIASLGAAVAMGAAVCLEEIGQSPTIAGGVIVGITLASLTLHLRYFSRKED